VPRVTRRKTSKTSKKTSFVGATEIVCGVFLVLLGRPGRLAPIPRRRAEW
jgi:hypothetical protein